MRDASRPLVSQVLWGHEEGLEKDVRTLLHEEASSLKVYFVRDKVKNRAKLEEILQSYRESNTLQPFLRGLRIVPIPDAFDADSERERQWMSNFVLNAISSDLLFAVVFGKLTHSDLRTFSLHGGPIGLKLAVLHLIDKEGFQHGPTFEKRVGSKGSPLREAITMLTGVGFIIAPGFSIQRVPTIKGRFFLDLCRLIAYEYKNLPDWSDETKILLRHLRVDPKDGREEVIDLEERKRPLWDIITSIDYARRSFGIDIMEDVDLLTPKFYSDFAASKFLHPTFHGSDNSLWADADDVVDF